MKKRTAKTDGVHMRAVCATCGWRDMGFGAHVRWKTEEHFIANPSHEGWLIREQRWDWGRA